MMFMWKTAKYTWRDHKTNEEILNKFKITSIIDKIASYKSDWIQHVNLMPRSRVPNLLTIFAPRGVRYQGRPLKRPLGEWDWNRLAMACFPEIEMIMMTIRSLGDFQTKLMSCQCPLIIFINPVFYV
jgi:hypothetical protein